MHTTSLLLGSLLGGLGGGALLLLAVVAGLGASETKSAESFGLLLLRGDSTGLLGLVNNGEGGKGAGDVSGEVLSLDISLVSGIEQDYCATYLSVTRLGHTLLLGEDNKTRAVLLQAVDVDLLALLGLGAATLVNDNAETLGLLLGDTGELELGSGEATALCLISSARRTRPFCNCRPLRDSPPPSCSTSPAHCVISPRHQSGPASR